MLAGRIGKGDRLNQDQRRQTRSISRAAMVRTTGSVLLASAAEQANTTERMDGGRSARVGANQKHQAHQPALAIMNVDSGAENPHCQRRRAELSGVDRALAHQLPGRLQPADPRVHLLELRLEGGLPLGSGLQFVFEGQFALPQLHRFPVGLILGSLDLGLGLKPLLLLLVVEDGDTGNHHHHGRDKCEPRRVLPIWGAFHTFFYAGNKAT